MEVFTVVWGMDYEGGSTCGIYSKYELAYQQALEFIKERNEWAAKWEFDQDKTTWRRGDEYLAIRKFIVDLPLFEGLQEQE